MNEQDHSGFEQKLRAKLEGVQFTPPVSLKAKVFADYKHTHRRKRLIWWLFGGLGLGIGTLALLFILSESKTIETNVNGLNQVAKAPVQDETAGELAAPSPALSDVKHDWVEQKLTPNIGDDAAFNPIQESAQLPLSEQAKATAPSNFAVEEVVTELLEGTTDRLEGIVIDVDLADSKENVANDTNASANESTFSSTGSVALNMPVADKPSLKSQDDFAERMELAPTRFALQLPYFNQETAGISNRDVDLQTATTLSASNIEPCSLKYLIGVSGGLGISYRTLNSNVHHELVNHKNKAEHAAISSSAGVYGVASLFRQFGIKSGITYLRVGERYHFENDHASHETVNSYTYLNLDLKLNQTLVCTGPFRLDLAVGTKANLLTKAQSSWLDPHSFEAVLHDNSGQHSPFRDYNLVWSADLTSYYFFSRNGFIGMSVEADRFHNSVYKDAVGLDQRPYAIQAYFNFGFRF
jgi:hypothetical protein